ncbi:MAG: P1 family peptidase [Clostridia bacterium]|nr:P1 family peptidase [Clostridia bacterium]
MGTDMKIGLAKKGKRNLISDIKGVTVGHVTIKGENINTGVTAIRPHGGNMFTEKVLGAVHVINGYGKSTGLIQVEELGTIETPIILTNTLSVGTAATGLIRYMMEDNPDIGGKDGTVNPLVFECNDGGLSDIRGMHITESHVYEALANTTEEFEEGAVGAGTGMSCFGFKGGIGSASRVTKLDGEEYTVGVLVLTNFGSIEHLRINGKAVGAELREALRIKTEADKGSVIVVIATDAPLNERQLKRLCKRAAAGLARVGSYYGNGSGDIAVAFSTAQKLPHNSKRDVLECKRLFDNSMDKLFPLVVEAVEEAVLSSMLHAETTVGKGKTRYSLKEFVKE